MADFKFLMFFVWAAAMMIACWAVEVARVFARRVTKEAARQSPTTTYHPPIAVILPIKGRDPDTEANLHALLTQDYPTARFLFAVESPDDPILPLLHQLAASQPATRIDIVIAGIAQSRGQKIHNQLAAINRTTPADEALIFMDADARPGPGWLAALVDPLQEPDVGATTGFRFYIPSAEIVEYVPIPANDPRLLPSAMASIINAAVAALLGPGWRNIAWGGSMAIKRENLFSYGIHQAWQNAVSDDYVLSHCVRKLARKRIQFVQRCLVESTADFTWPAFFEFAARQYRITKVCAPWVWLTALSAAALYLTALTYTLTFWIISLFSHHPDHPLLIMFLALYIAQALRGYYLWRGGQAAPYSPRLAGGNDAPTPTAPFPNTPPPTTTTHSDLIHHSSSALHHSDLIRHSSSVIRHSPAARLHRIRLHYTLGYPLSIAINLLALLQSAFGRTITWRGTRYTLRSRTQTTLHRPAPIPPAPVTRASCPPH